MRDFLALHDDSEVVREAADGSEAIAPAADLRPDIIVMDLMRPNVDGIEATARVKAADPAIEVIALTRTARTHVSNILAKLGLAGRTHAALLAVQHGLDRET